LRPLTPPWTPPELRVPSPSERRCSLPRPRHSAGRRPDGRVCPLAWRRWLRRARARARRPIATSASEPLCEENSESRGHSHSVTVTLSHCEHKDKTDTRQYSTASRDRHSLRDQYSGIHTVPAVVGCISRQYVLRKLLDFGLVDHKPGCGNFSVDSRDFGCVCKL